MRNFSTTRTTYQERTDKNKIVLTNKIFIGDTYILKTEITDYNLWIVLVPRDKKSILKFDDSLEAGNVERNDSRRTLVAIKHFLSKAECVKKILFLAKEGTIHIWTAIFEYNNENNRKLVYGQEIELTRFLKGADCYFDFHLTELEEVDEIVSLGAKVIYDRI